MIALLSEKCVTIRHFVQRMAVGMEPVYNTSMLLKHTLEYLDFIGSSLEGGVTVREDGNPPLVN